MFKITVTQEVPLYYVACLLCNAFESSATRYWCRIQSYIVPKNPRPVMDEEFDKHFKRIVPGNHVIYKHVDFPLCEGGAVVIENVGDEPDQDAADYVPEIHIINLETITKGLQVMATKFPKHFADIVAETDDASTADVFLQCMVFGDVLYG